MPNVKAKPRGLQNGDVVTEFTDTTSINYVTYTYPIQQLRFVLENSSDHNIYVTIGSYTDKVILPNETWEVDVAFTSFSIRSDVKSQEFVVTTYQYDVEGNDTEVNSKLNELQSSLAQKAAVTDVQLLSEKVGVGVKNTLTTGALRNGNIVVIGDSITAGQGGSRIYAYWLEATIQGLNITNVGVGGVKIRYHIDNSSAFLNITPKPNIAVVLIGTNDLNPEGNVAQMKIDYKELIGLLITNNITPVLCTLLPRSDNAFIVPTLIKFNEFIREYGRVNGFTVIDTFVTFANSDGTPKTGYLSADNLHPTTFGYMRLVEELAPKLPIPLKHVPWKIPGTTNIISNPTFNTDSNGDSRADNWLAFSNGGIVPTYALIDHPVEGKWQQISKTGGVDANSLTYVSQTITFPSDIVAGDTILFGVDVDTDDFTVGEIEIAGQFFTSADGYISAATLMGRTPTQIKEKRFVKKYTVPANATKIKILLTIYGNGSTVARFGRVLVKRIESV